MASPPIVMPLIVSPVAAIPSTAPTSEMGMASSVIMLARAFARNTSTATTTSSPP